MIRVGHTLSAEAMAMQSWGSMCFSILQVNTRDVPLMLHFHARVPLSFSDDCAAMPAVLLCGHVLTRLTFHFIDSARLQSSGRFNDVPCPNYVELMGI
jgi:hypothetical protein